MDTNEVKEYYEQSVKKEWERLEGAPEFLFTTRIMARYIKPCDRVLDIGGGPGRYSLWLAERGCDVTLIDLSEENVRFAKTRAEERGLPLTAISGDALDVLSLVSGEFDHVLLMGPLYHLLEESDRYRCTEAALELIRSGGLLWAAFLNLFSGVNWAITECPAAIADESEQSYLQHVAENRSWGGEAFTIAYFCAPAEALGFMGKFGLERLHFFNQEGIIGANDYKPALINQQPPEIIDMWLDYGEKLLDMPEYYALASHLMYVGRKS